MKRNILLAMAMVFTLATYAQRPNRPMYGKEGKPGMGQGKGDMQKKMAQELNLTDAQKKQMKDMQDAFREKMKTLNQNESITVKQQRDEMYNLQKQHRANMKKVLTPEQQEKMTAIRNGQEKKIQEAQLRRMDKIAVELKLSEAQKTQFAQLQTSHQTAMRALMQNDNIDRTAKEKQVKALMDQHKKDMEKLLNKEQQKQLEEMKKDNPKQQRGRGDRGMGRPAVI